MAETNISTNSPQAAKLYGVALFSQLQQSNSKLRRLAGKKPTGMSEVTEKIGKIQSSPGLPIVEVYDLAKTAGDRVVLDCMNIKSSLPIMGDENREGKGDAVSMSSMEIKIDKWSFVADSGGTMSQQRTPHNLLTMAREQGKGNASKYWEQRNLVHLAGARGVDNSNNWTVPLETHPKYASIMINPVKAPTYNRHYVVSGNDLVQGGQQLGSISSADLMKIDHLEIMRAIIDGLTTTLQPIQLPDDMSAADSPMWALLTPSNVYSTIKKDPNFRQLQADVNARAAATGKSNHPLFVGDVGMWNGILVIKITQAIVRFLASSSTNIVTAANAGTANETAQVVNPALTAGFAVERSMLIGAQALGCGYGMSTASGGHMALVERKYNFDSASEVAVEGIEGVAKVRFDTLDANGNKIPTDHGVIVIDSAAKLAVL